MTTRRVTIAHIADAAGVSVPTVSKVVNGREDVAPGTRARVEALLEEHGYRRYTFILGGYIRALVSMVALTNFFNRVNTTLRVQPGSWD